MDSYRVRYSYFVDHGSPEFTARVFTPDDKAIQTPNSDTPYSFLGADLRAEPLVLTVPIIENERYYSLQFIDMYTFNFAYVGSRATGNDGEALETFSGLNQGFSFVGIRFKAFNVSPTEITAHSLSPEPGTLQRLWADF